MFGNFHQPHNIDHDYLYDKNDTIEACSNKIRYKENTVINLIQMPKNTIKMNFFITKEL